MEALAPFNELRQEVSVKASQQSEDLELIHRSQAGDTDAFDELVTKYRTKIFSMIYGIVGNECDAWDLAQESFLKAWRSIHRFRVDLLSIRGCTVSRQTSRLTHFAENAVEAK